MLKKVVIGDDCIFWTGRRFGKVDLTNRVTDWVSVGKVVCNDLSRFDKVHPRISNGKNQTAFDSRRTLMMMNQPDHSLTLFISDNHLPHFRITQFLEIFPRRLRISEANVALRHLGSVGRQYSC